MTDTTGQPASADLTYNVRFYRPSDEEGMLRVLQASFPRWPEVETYAAPIDHLRWKLAGADPPEHNHLVAELDGAVIAARISINQHYRVRGERILARVDMDMGVAPEYRGRGVYSRLAPFGVEHSLDAALVMNSTDRPSLVEWDRQFGHHPFKNRLNSMECDLSLPHSTEPETSSIAVREANSFDERTSSLWEEASGPFAVVASPTVDWLNWRYCDSRGGIGTLLFAEEQGRLLGFAALRCSRGKGHIAYVLALPERHDAVRALGRSAVAYFRAAGISSADCALPRRHPYRTPLEQVGFSHKGHAIPLSCRSNPPRARDMAFLEQSSLAVHVMFGDIDIV